MAWNVSTISTFPRPFFPAASRMSFIEMSDLRSEVVPRRQRDVHVTAGHHADEFPSSSTTGRAAGAQDTRRVGVSLIQRKRLQAVCGTALACWYVFR